MARAASETFDVSNVETGCIFSHKGECCYPFNSSTKNSCKGDKKGCTFFVFKKDAAVGVTEMFSKSGNIFVWDPIGETWLKFSPKPHRSTLVENGCLDRNNGYCLYHANGIVLASCRFCNNFKR